MIVFKNVNRPHGIVKKDSCEESRPKLATKVFSYISNARTHYARARCISS